MKNKKILCIDASLSCTGYAIFDGDILIDKGYINNKYIKCKAKDIHSEKLLCIFNALNKLEHEYNFDLVIIERSFCQFNNSTKAIHKVLGVIELLFNKKEIILIAPQSTKSYLCHKDATKNEMIRAINFIYGLNLDDSDKSLDDNIADAIALGNYYLSHKEKY